MLATCSILAFAAPLLRDPLPASAGEALPAYTFSVTLSDSENMWRGTGTIAFQNPTDQPLAELPILLPPNAGEIARFSLTQIEVVEGPAATFAVGHPSDGLLTFSRPLAPGERVLIEVAFGAPLRDLGPGANDLLQQGLGQLSSLGAPGGGGDYGLLASGDGIYVAASAFPMIRPMVSGQFAHRVVRAGQSVGDLTWNTPASFSVRIETPPGLLVVTNLSDKVLEDTKERRVILAEGQGATDFIAVASRQFVVDEQKVGDVTVRSWSLAADREAGRSVLATGARSLRFFERYGRYPFTELDLVEASLIGGAGGVEFSGLALVAASLYRDPMKSLQGSPLAAMLPGLGQGVDISSQRDFVVAHEVAHQWSPMLAIGDAWNDPVLDEPLAQYLAWRVITEGKPKSEAIAIAERHLSVNYALFRLMSGKDAPAARPTSAYATNLEYAALVYGKAPWLYLSLESKVGKPAMDRALAQAFSRHRFAAVDHETWLADLEAAGAAGAVALGDRCWEQPNGDVDLGIDPEGRAAMRMLFGPSAAQIEAMLSAQGLTLPQLIQSMGGAQGAPPAAIPGVPPGFEGLLDGLLGK